MNLSEHMAEIKEEKKTALNKDNIKAVPDKDKKTAGKRNWVSFVFYWIIRSIVWLVYPKTKLVGTEKIPQKDVILVGNHTQMNGPIIAELYFPENRLIWCNGEMMHLKEVPDYAFTDFWSMKPKWLQPFYRVLSYLIAPLSVLIFTNADVIPVYRDARVMTTFKETMEKLEEGHSIVIFPECGEPYNQVVYEFQEHFVDVARLYYRKTKREVSFLPMYLAPALKKVYFGTPTVYDHTSPIEEERARISDYLKREITDLAVALPRHRVVPYKNISKKEYPYNRAEE